GFHHHVTLVSAAHLFCTEHHLNPKGAATASVCTNRDPVPDRADRLPARCPACHHQHDDPTRLDRGP
ncbi:hypothetical protein EST92_30920, partial [Streptomyces sp. TM32]